MGFSRRKPSCVPWIVKYQFFSENGDCRGRSSRQQGRSHNHAGCFHGASSQEQVALLYQQVPGRELDPNQPQVPVADLAADLLNRPEARDSELEARARYQAVNRRSSGSSDLSGSPPGKSQRTDCTASGARMSECIYNNLLNRAPTTPELAAHKSQPPVAIFFVAYNSPKVP